MPGLFTMSAERNFELAQQMRLRVANLPAKHLETRLSDLDMSRYSRDSLAKIEEFAATGHSSGFAGRGLYFAGFPGDGKTTVACALLNEARYRRKSWVRFQTLPDLLAMRQEIIRLDRRADRGDEVAFEESDRLYRLIRRMDGEQTGRGEPPFGVLVLDDVGKEHRTSSGWATEEFDRIIRGRFNKGLPTILTTNLTLEDWEKEGYHPSTKSFLREAFAGAPLSTGHDFRAGR